MSDIKTLRDMILVVLDDEPDTRNSDVRLMTRIWERFFGAYMLLVGGHKAVWIDDLFKLPREDQVKRIRARIQNVERMYPPTAWKIAEKRGWLVDVWKRAMGYHVQNPGQLGLPV